MKDMKFASRWLTGASLAVLLMTAGCGGGGGSSKSSSSGGSVTVGGATLPARRHRSADGWLRQN